MMDCTDDCFPEENVISTDACYGGGKVQQQKKAEGCYSSVSHYPVAAEGHRDNLSALSCSTPELSGQQLDGFLDFAFDKDHSAFSNDWKEQPSDPLHEAFYESLGTIPEDKDLSLHDSVDPISIGIQNAFRSDGRKDQSYEPRPETLHDPFEPTPINIPNIHIVKEVPLSHPLLNPTLMENLKALMGPLKKVVSPQTVSRASPPVDRRENSSPDGTRSTCSSTSTRSAPALPEIQSYQLDQWNDRYYELIEYKRKYGHCNVPYDWKENKPLSQWVKCQRGQQKLKQEGKHNTLADHCQRLLDKIGFLWDVREASWFTRYEELAKFHKTHGHVRVSKTNPKQKPLAVWLKRQRRDCRKYLSGDRIAGTTPERINKLAALGAVKIDNVPLPSSSSSSSSKEDEAMGVCAEYDFCPSMNSQQQYVLEYSLPVVLPDMFYLGHMSKYGLVWSFTVVVGHTIETMLTNFGKPASRPYAFPLIMPLQHHLLDCGWLHSIITGTLLVPERFGAGNENRISSLWMGVILIQTLPIYLTVSLKSDFKKNVLLFCIELT